MADPHTNRLIHEKSPYLRQHARNPVDWYPWGPEAFARARAEDRPLLLSVGYSACHWCHVMERESFEDEETAALMNERFVCVKVDREERPDVDQVYQHAVQMLTHHGGWPLTVFLTPDGKPFFGGTYFPPDERYGRPSFRRVLAALSTAWKERRADIEESVRQILVGLERMNELEGPGLLTPDLPRQAASALLQRIDGVHGGFRGAPKFPNATSLSFLLGRAVRGPDEAARDAVLFTLRKMAHGGIYDQLGGGFHRYSVDAEWLVPHFEKMLYDNAQLVALYLDAWKLTGDAVFRRIADESIRYLLREMRAPEGGFYSTQDADSEGEEGKFFVWTPSQIEEVVGGENARVLCAAFGVTPEGSFEHGATVLHLPRSDEAVAASLDLSVDVFRQIVREGRRALFEARESRVKPARDDKILTGWNGLLIAALARSPEAAHLAAATGAADFVLRVLWRDGCLARSYQEGAVLHEGVLDDYAFLADGLLRLHAASAGARWIEAAVRITEALLARFWDPETQAFYLTAPNIDLFQRPRSIYDQATPAGSGIAAQVLLRLEALTGGAHYGKIARDFLRNLAEPMRENPFGLSSLLEALEADLHGLREVVVVGSLAEPETARLLDAARGRYAPDLLVCHHPGDSTPPPAELAAILEGKRTVGGRPAAYVCRERTCAAPVTDAGELAELLDRAAHPLPG